MINIYSAYSYLSNLDKNIDNKDNFSLKKLAHIEVQYHDLHKHDERLDLVESSTIEKDDIVYLAKYSYIPEYLVEQYSNIKITSDITKCTKMVFVINNLFDNRNGFYMNLRNNDFCIVPDSLYNGNVKLACSEMDKEIPNEGIYKIFKTIATTKTEYEFILNNPDKIVDRSVMIQELSKKQLKMNLDNYDQIVQMLKSPAEELKKIALSSMVSFALADNDNKTYLDSLLNEYDNEFYSLKIEPEYLYLTEGYNMFKWAQNDYSKSK